MKFVRVFDYMKFVKIFAWSLLTLLIIGSGITLFGALSG